MSSLVKENCKKALYKTDSIWPYMSTLVMLSGHHNVEGTTSFFPHFDLSVIRVHTHMESQMESIIC